MIDFMRLKYLINKGNNYFIDAIKYINTGAFLIRLPAMKTKPDTRKLKPHIQQMMRGEIVHLRMFGKSNRYVAETVGVSERHASAVWQRYLREGNAVIASKQRGRKKGEQKVLSFKQEVKVLEMLLEKPSSLKMESQLWTRNLLQQAIKRHLKINVSIRTVGERLKLWGMVPQRPIMLNSEASPPEIQRWINNDYQKILERAHLEGGEILWCVEKAIGCMGGSAFPSHQMKGMPMLSAITNQGQIRFMLNRNVLSSETFIEFMSRLVSATDRKVILLMKPTMALYHGKRVGEWLEDNKANIEVLYLSGITPATRGSEQPTLIAI